MSRIVRVEIGRYDYRVVGAFKFLKPSADGVLRRPSVLVRLTDSDGAQGWGQAVPLPTWSDETPETVESTLREYLAPALLGVDAEDLEGIHVRLHSIIKPAFAIGQPICKAAIDIACHDLIARKRGVPVHALLGDARVRTLDISWTVSSPDLEEAERQLDEGIARGFRHFNIKLGPPQTPDYDIALAKRVRQAAPNAFLWADANTGYTLDTALQVAPRLANAGVNVLESPLPPTNIRGYQALRKQGALPILMDEGIFTPEQTAEFVALGMMDGVALKPARNAGLWYSWRIVRLLQEEGLLVLGSGLTDPDLALAAAVHLYAAAGITLPCALNGPQFLADWLTGDVLHPREGQMAVPSGHGLGVTPSSGGEPVLTVVAEL